MPTSLFTITPLVPSVALDDEGRGSATFTVTNISGRTVRGRAKAIAEDGGSEAARLSIDGVAERTFQPEETLQYVVRVESLPAAPAGTHRFRLDMVSEENPDDEYTRGPLVTFTVRAGGRPVVTKRGYRATMLGTLIGVFAGGTAGLAVGAVVGTLVAVIGGDLGSVFGGILLFALLSVPGPWLGAVAATWLLLRSRGYGQVPMTAGALAVAFPVWAVAFVFVLATLLEGPAAILVFFLVGLPTAVVLPALAARGFALRLGTGAF